jgi:class 3 adenylate cyclase
MERRLAAVMIADVVGYGRLSQIDEEGTRACFQYDLEEVFKPSIAAHRGRLVKTMGDGLLVEFPSVVDALRSAVEVQQHKTKRNAGVPADKRLEFRIGINLGDIIVEGEDIHGDGVNIADRMQALANPGGIAISGTAYDQVKAKLPVGYASLGEQRVKSNRRACAGLSRADRPCLSRQDGRRSGRSATLAHAGCCRIRCPGDLRCGSNVVLAGGDHQYEPICRCLALHQHWRG